MLNGKQVDLYGCHLLSNNYSVVANSIKQDDIDGVGTFRNYLQNIKNASVLRKQAANVIIDSLLTLSTPFVVLGDMNDVVGSPALCVFKDAGFTDAWWECGTG